MIRAAIDLGSNTLRLLVADVEDGQIKQRLCYQHQITRLGQNLHQTGVLSQQAMQRSQQVIQGFKQAIDACGTIEICATATSAVRKASNGKAFLDMLYDSTGVDVHLISEQCEAELCLHGVMTVFPEKDFLLFDIGGGSTEFSRVRHGHVLDSHSFSLGVVDMTERLLHSDPPSLYDYQKMQQHADVVCKQVEQAWSTTWKPRFLVGTAGTVTTLAALDLKLACYDVQKVNGHVLTKKSLALLKQQLLALDHAQRSQWPGLEAGRVDLIIAGLAIVERLMCRWHYPKLVCIDAGLLEGSVLLGQSFFQVYSR